MLLLLALCQILRTALTACIIGRRVLFVVTLLFTTLVQTYINVRACDLESCGALRKNRAAPRATVIIPTLVKSIL